MCRCRCLNSLPPMINLEALVTFDLSGCSKLKKFPYIVENMPRLERLDLSETAIKDLSLLVIHSTGLRELNLEDCKNLSSLPIAICSLMSLRSIRLTGCSKLDELPENLGKMEGLKVLCLSGTAITCLPSFVHLKNLKYLSLSGCVGLPSSFVHSKNLEFLYLSGWVGPSSNKLTRFPLTQPRRSPDLMGVLEHSLIGLCSLTTLNLSYCNFQTIPNVFWCLSSLETLNLEGNNFVCLPESIFQLSNLTHLNLSYCNVQIIPNVLGCLSSLGHLNLRGNNFVCLPESIIQLSKLITLKLGGCTHLRMLPKLPLNIRYIEATKCTSLETLSLRPESDFRPYFSLLGCNKLIKNQDYGDLFSTMLRRHINTQVCLSLSLSLSPSLSHVKF